MNKKELPYAAEVLFSLLFQCIPFFFSRLGVPVFGRPAFGAQKVSDCIGRFGKQTFFAAFFAAFFRGRIGFGIGIRIFCGFPLFAQGINFIRRQRFWLLLLIRMLCWRFFLSRSESRLVLRLFKVCLTGLPSIRLRSVRFRLNGISLRRLPVRFVLQIISGWCTHRLARRQLLRAVRFFMLCMGSLWSR